ncbi:hypothetical protein GCM10010402_04910 [Actinomadura luteofluorescens]|uniref:HU family DNA-binding protein n=1 Tax=Actinomadura luteofluorescens TaxID=46163 RepID=UPI002164ED3E|nr:HU family DNA-binding protein [Actinomadura glauciflava]MCR3740845.1 hypothetical protein [Actinomadura glauciflava]
MGWRIEADGYTAEFTDDLEVVFHNPQGRRLKQFPAQLGDAPGVAAMYTVRKYLKRHEEQCGETARSWAAEGVGVPRALADADPFWATALDEAGVTLTTDPVEGGLCARTYVGPDDRRLTQVLRESTVRYRDLLMAVDGWEPEGLFETGLPAPYASVVPFPERIIEAHPEAEGLAVEKVHTLEARTARWRSFYKPAVEEILSGLEESAPDLLITLLDEVADAALAQDEPNLAPAWFARARKLERTLARRPDPEWLADRYEEHAHVLSATVLRAWARDLSAKGAATPEGLARFREVMEYRVEDGGDVYPQLAADLRKIAKAAGLDPEEELAAFLRSLFAADEVSLNDEAFWNDALKGRAMDLVSGAEAARPVLELRPGYPTQGPLWLKLLDRSGALAMLAGETPGLQRGDAAAWLVARMQGSQWRDPLGELYEVAERIAPRLASDGVPVEFRFWRLDETGRRRTPLDLIDILLEHGVPVADPPERLGPAFLPDLVCARRPELRHVLADERFARELRGRARGDLDMTVGDQASNTWYEPHETKGWGALPVLFDNPIGHEEVRAWCARERALLREGVDLYGLRMLLARFVHVGVAVDLLLKDAETAREFAAVDVMALLMADLPDDFTRERVEELMKLLEPHYINRAVSGPNFVALSKALPELKEQDRETFDRVAFSLVTAVNCRVGLERLVRRFTPGEEAKEAPKEKADPVVRQCGWLMDLAGSGTPVWDGDMGTPSGKFDGNLIGLELRPNHINTAVHTGVPSRSRARSYRRPAAYASYPFVSGEPGRWRVVRCELPEDTKGGMAMPGMAFRTPTSVALVVSAKYGVPPERLLLEYAPEGKFAEEGPLAAAGARLLDACVLEPVRSRDWFARFSELWRERDRPQISPELAAAFAEKTGLSQTEAAVVLQGAVSSAPYQLGEDDPVRLVHFGSGWNSETGQVKEGLRALRPPEFYTRLYERLLPDDPEELWTSGPAVDRALAWCSERSEAPFPVPAGLLPRALKEITQPKGEIPVPRADLNAPWPWRSGRAPLRPWVLLGRVAAGADCLADGSAFAGEPDPLALPRVAAWLAYRTPAGDPLRPAVGAAISRLREASGPRTLFSLQSNYLMGDPPPTDVLTAHPAVTLVEDDVLRLRHLRVDPAAVKGPDDPLLDILDDYYDATLPSQVVPGGSGLPALADLRLLLSDDFAALGAHLAGDADLAPGWEQHPARSVPQLVEECAETHRLGEDAAALYLMLLALPDPSDRNVKEWTGWKPARFKAAVAELGGTGLVLSATRARAGRSLFVHGAWREHKAPRLPIEVPKIRLLPMADERRSLANMAAVPSGPVPVLFDRAWRDARPRGLR